MYDLSEAKAYSIWQHNKTGGVYVVLCKLIVSTNGPDNGKTSILYTPAHGDGLVFYAREATEFLDGRFTPLLVPPPLEARSHG